MTNNQNNTWLSLLRRVLTGWPAKLLLGLTAGYLLFAYFAVDPLARRVLPWVAENKLASRMSAERVRFDPLRLAVAVDKLRLTTADGTALAGFDHLAVDLEIDSLTHWAWHLKDIRLTAPRANLDIAPDGSFNWAALIAKLNEDKTESPMPRVLIDHILIEQGNIAYAERNRPQPLAMALQPLGLELDGLSTLPDDRGDYLLSARLPDQGGTLMWKGDLALNPVASKGTVEIRHIAVARLLQFAPQGSLPIKSAAGELETRFGYDFSMLREASRFTPRARLTDFNIDVSGFSGDLEPQAKVALERASLKLPALTFSMQQGMQLKLQDVAASLDKLSVTQPGGTHLDLDAAEVTLPEMVFTHKDVMQLQLQDMNATARKLALKHGDVPLFQLGQAGIQGVDFDLAQNRLNVAEVTLDNGEVRATRGKDGTLDWQKLIPASTAPAAAEPPPAAVPLTMEAANIQLRHWKAAFTDQTFVRPLRAEIKDITLGAGVSGTADALAVSRINVDLAAIALHSTGEAKPVFSLDKVSLKNGAVDLGKHSVKLPLLAMSGPRTEVIREAGKPLNWQAILAQSASPAAAADNKKSDWKVALDKLSVENGRVHVEDRALPAPVVLDVESAMLDVRDASLDLAKPLPVKAAFRVQQGGQFEASGKLAPEPLKGDFQLRLDGLSLKPFSPYLNKQAFLMLNDGLATVGGKLALSVASPLKAEFAGGFSIDQLALHEEQSGAPFFGWGSVASDSLRLSLNPDQLHMDELRIRQPTGKFIIYEDKTLNVKRILRPTDAAPPVSADAAAQDAFPVTIDRVSIQNSDFEFADLSLKPQFGTHVNSLGGVINGLSSSPDATAQVELDGKVDEFGAARIRGSVQPFHATDFTDLKLAFHNLEMNRLTPYSGKFAGRKIDSGKLSVDLEYKIKQRQLTGENKFVIHKIKLGERVQSPDAANLPLDLAIALLEDSDGVIDLDLPIAGSLDDPQFSYGKIIWKAVVNVVSKIATAPFRALGKQLGVNAEKMEAITFEPGKAALAPPEQEKLKSVGEALAKRRNLALTVTPAYDPALDKPALQELATRRDVAAEIGLQLKDGETPGPIDLNNPKVQLAMENLLKDRKGVGRSLKVVDSLKGYFKKKTPEDAQNLQAALAQLKATANVGDAELLALAKQRAAALETYLKGAGLEPGRIRIAEPAKAGGEGGAVKLKLAVGLVKE